MYSKRSEQIHKQPHGEQSARQWGDYNDRWEERRETLRDEPQASYHKYGGIGHSGNERTKQRREYNDSHKRHYSKDTMTRDWNRNSPVRRRMSSPDLGAADKKRRFAEDVQSNYIYMPKHQDKTFKQSQDSFSQIYGPKDFDHTRPQEEDFKSWKTFEDSRHRKRQEEFTYRQQNDDRVLTGYYKDRDHRERSWDPSKDRTQSQECSTKSFGKHRKRDDSPSTGHGDHCKSTTRFPLLGSGEKSFEADVTNRSPTVPEQKSAKGFQRFLDVLNKGVNVAMLTKIVTQTSPAVSDQPHSPVAFMNTTDHLWSPSTAGKQQEGHQNNHLWGKSEEAHTQLYGRSFSPRGHSLSEEMSLRRSDKEQSYHGLNSISMSPSVVANKTLTPDDEHKHRQMQDVLQAIGMDLGSEELGQMSHRIQERLYGKKDSDRGRHRGGSKERDTRQSISPRHRSRSSSSSNRSNFSSLPRDNYKKKDSCSAQRDVTEVHQLQVNQAVEYGRNGSSGHLQDNVKCVTNSGENIATLQAFPPNTTYSVSNPTLTPAMPTYSPVNYAPMQYPPLPQNLPHVGPRLFFPPYPPYSHNPPLNAIPGVFTQTSHLLPQHISYPQSTFFNMPRITPYQPLNTAQKSKSQLRPRCLQVIETKQPG